MQPKKDVLLSTVRIIGIFSQDKELILGTGFALHRDEQQNYTYIVTCAHVILMEVKEEKAEKIRVDSKPGRQVAEIIAIGQPIDIDLAILAVKDLNRLPLLSPSSHIVEKMSVKIPGTQLITDKKIPKTETLEGHLGKTILVGNWRQSWIIEQLDKKDLQGYSGSPAIDPNDNVFGIVSTEQSKDVIALSLSVLKDLLIKDDEHKHTSLIQFLSQLPDNITSTNGEAENGGRVSGITSDPASIDGSILELSPESQNKNIKLTNQLYQQIWDERKGVIYACDLFEKGKAVTGPQYKRLDVFLVSLNKPLYDLLQTIELLPQEILPWRFPIRDALYKATRVITELRLLFLKSNLAPWRQEIQQKFQLLTCDIDKVTLAFSELCTRFQNDTW